MQQFTPIYEKLYPFQQEAFHFGLDSGLMLLSLDPGLGKTVTSIAICEQLMEDGRARGGLVIVPATLKFQWLDEIARWAPDSIAIVIDGTPKQREEQYRRAARAEYVIVNYEQIVNDWDKVWSQHHGIDLDFIIADEVTYLKSFTSKRSKRVKRLADSAEFRIGLTGTPVENRAEEAYSLMQFVDPDLLGRFDIFDRTFIVRNDWGQVDFYRNLPLLHKLLSERMYRRTRKDPEIASQLPKVQHIPVRVHLDRKTATVYNDISQTLQAEMAEMVRTGGWDIAAHYGQGSSESHEQQGWVMSMLLAMRMLVGYPEVLRTAKGRFAQEIVGNGRLPATLGHAKRDYLYELLEEILEDPDSKVVVFSFFKSMLKLIADDLADRGIVCELFTGDQNAKQKAVAKKRFQGDREVRVLLSSDAGGYGVDLPQANYLINYDLPWSAGALEQRNSRIIRLSSQFDHLTIYHLMCEHTVEEWVYEVVTSKRTLADAIVDGEGVSSKGELTLPASSLTTFLEEHVP